MLSVLDSIDGELYKLIKIVANGKRGRGRGGGFFDVYHFFCEDRQIKGFKMAVKRIFFRFNPPANPHF